MKIVVDALAGRHRLEDSLDSELGDPDLARLDERDRGFVKALAGETLRRYGQLHDALARFMTRRRPRSAGPLEAILAVGACQILFLDTPAHAAVDLSVRLALADKDSRHYKGLVNAVLRRVAEAKHEILADQDAVALNTPPWLSQRWAASYGATLARQIQAAHLEPPPLDLTVRRDPEAWAARLGGTALPTGTVRLTSSGRVAELDGYETGAWWVQDAAAALPARLLGDVAGRRIADLCAAPGGKTAQLAAAGATVMAVERSAERLGRLRANLERLALDVETINADATDWRPPAAFDAILLDAPCTATGTLRRHPDIAWRRRPAELNELLALQRRLLDNALAMLAPGGRLVYAVCSLEPEEGVAQVDRVVAEGQARRVPITAEEIGGLADCVTAAGDMRTLPVHLPGAPGGMDGFFAARLMLA